tara:strand:+ start:1122 stop:3872 length:2751 start_codon:yes stop_codon:yes gene_type:complete
LFEAQNLKARLDQAGVETANAAEQFGNDLSKSLSKPFVTSPNISLDPLGAALAGPIADVKGAVNDLSAALSNPTAAIGNALSDALGGAFGGLMGGVGAAGPQKNPLSKFSSYNNIFTFGAIKRESFNDPDSTYRLTGPDVIVLQSGGSGNRQVRTQLEKAAGITGEYFIDDVEIKCLVAPGSKTKQTNATNISFNVMEPYSMGLFLQTLHIAAAQAGYTNYLECVYLLQVDFIGYDDNGRSFKDSNSKRMFPLKLSNVTFDVSEGGSNYEVTAIPYHEIALSDEIQQTQVAVDIKGTTIVDFLQTGPESLATILNTREQEQVKAGNKKIADEYVIMFPNELTSASASGAGKTEDTNGATTQSETSEAGAVSEEKKQELFEQLSGIEGGEVPADFDAEISKILGIVVKRSQIGESIREAAEKEENVNIIGKSKVAKNYLDEGKQMFGKPAFTEDKEKAPGVFQRGNIKISDEGRRINFASGTKIQTIIEEVLLLSDYARRFVTEQPDTNGMKTWFRIETDLFLIPGNDNVAQTGEGAKVFVYKVVPYKTHVARITSPTTAPPGYVNLRKQAARQYDYMYTGQNDDIINFDIDINVAFFQALSGDMGQLGKTQKTQGSNSLTAALETPVHGTSEGDKKNSSSAGISSAKSVPKTNTGESGSGVAGHPENQIARSFNDAIVNSEVDLVTIEFEIWGDPYYIADSGMGNYGAKNTGGINITSDGTMDYQSSEVDIIVNFRTPVDTRDEGYMKFPAGGSKAVGAFSGLYQVTEVTNTWSANKFSQKLKTIRRRNQPEDTGIKPLDIAIESVIEKGIDAIISPLASAPVAAFNGLQDDIQGAVNELSAALSASPVGGALANGVAALESEIGNIQNSLGAALQAPTIAAQQVSNALSSALSVPVVPPSISPPVTPPNQSGINT